MAALDERGSSGFVLVVEDTSELLRAQKAAAWHEVARRVAHEIKNPLTPIALCAERIARQLDRNPDARDAAHPARVLALPSRAKWNRCRRWWTSSRSSRASPPPSPCRPI